MILFRKSISISIMIQFKSVIPNTGLALSPKFWPHFGVTKEDYQPRERNIYVFMFACYYVFLSLCLILPLVGK